MLKFDKQIVRLMEEDKGLTVHGWIGTASTIRNLCFTNPLVGQPRFFGDDTNGLGGFVPDMFMLKRKGDKRNYKAIIDKPKQDDLVLDGTTVILMEPSDTFGLIEHYFHFVEHLIPVWNAHEIWNQHKGHPVKRVVLMSYEKPRWNWEGTNQINRHLLRALFPEAQVLTYDHLKKMAWRKTVRFERVISSDRAVANKEGKGKMLRGTIPFISRPAMRSMSTKVHESLGTKDESKLARRVLLSRRMGERSLTPELIHRLNTIVKFQGMELRSMDFAQFSFPQQLQAVRNADVFIGVHGNGLTHSAFLPPHAKVIEIFPPGSHLLEYRMLCEATNIRYHGIDPFKGEYTKQQSYDMGEVMGEQSKIRELPLDLIRRLL